MLVVRVSYVVVDYCWGGRGILAAFIVHPVTKAASRVTRRRVSAMRTKVSRCGNRTDRTCATLVPLLNATDLPALTATGVVREASADMVNDDGARGMDDGETATSAVQVLQKWMECSVNKYETE